MKLSRYTVATIKMSDSYNVKLSLQALSEYKVQEYSYDGRETILKPLTPSETLTDLANQINFLDVDEPSAQDDSDVIQDNAAKSFDGVKRHLQQALTEINVLVDVLSIAQNKPTINTAKEATPENLDAHRYFMYDVVEKDPDSFKASYQMITKKKALNSAAKILTNSSKRLEAAWSEAAGQVDFHNELVKVRKHWRLRRVGEKIIGDLSYRTAGSDFGQNGAFEVMKKSDDDDDDDDNDDDDRSGDGPPVSQLKSPIKVVVASELRGHASIFVSIIKLPDNNQVSPGSSCSLTYFDVVQNSLSGVNDPAWHRKLCNAQNVLFCKETFMLLTREAIQYKSRNLVAPFVVIDDVISTLIFPDTKIVVKLMHSKKIKKSKDTKDDQKFFSLKHALLQLLQAYHSRRLNVSPPHPVAAVLGLKDSMRKAATQAWPGRQISNICKEENETFAESLLKMAQHYVVRQQLSEVIDSIAHQFSDPNIQAHWSVVSSMYQSSVRVTLTNCGYEHCYRSTVQLTAMPTKVKAIQRSGTVSQLLTDQNSLYNFLISVICTHQLFVVHTLSRIVGWHVLQFSPHSGVGLSHLMLSRGTLLVTSPSGDKNISVTCSIDLKGNLNYGVKVQFAKVPACYDTSYKLGNDVTLEEVKSLDIRSEWLSIDWANCRGKYFLEKMETILTCILGCS